MCFSEPYFFLLPELREPELRTRVPVLRVRETELRPLEPELLIRDTEPDLVLLTREDLTELILEDFPWLVTLVRPDTDPLSI